ncbi:hypothetical protein QA596_09260 [Balneolales bacterium ANBcel1]|nr:hypothetical protein [Balneolales bacterium ANBcel1]
MNTSRTAWRSFVIDPDIPFEEKADVVFRHQYRHLPVYRNFCEGLGLDSSLRDAISPATPAGGASVRPEEYPLMPIQVFRDTQVRADYVGKPEMRFRSSGTTGSRRSTHHIADSKLYLESAWHGFTRFYPADGFAILAWLPGYMDNPESSLVAMIDHFVRQDDCGLSRFLPLDRTPGQEAWEQVTAAGKRVMLFGAAFGLLDLIDAGAPNLPAGSVIVETGGMKTRRRELSKQELRKQLAAGFGLPADAVHSEYGMAEMCSQAWDPGTGWFRTPPWLRISIRDAENPLQTVPAGEQGLIGIIDLANVHSLSFFLTQDMGIARQDGTFQVLGRRDHAELRGCNFLMED